MSYAGFGKRFAAVFIDGIITMIGGVVIGVIFGIIMVVGGTDDPDVIEGLANILGIVLGWLYYSVMESSPTQGTLGKMALGIKVTDLEGKRVGFGKATGRHFGKIVSVLLLGIGFIMAAFTRKKQALHDMMANTLVVNRNVDIVVWPDSTNDNISPQQQLRNEDEEDRNRFHQLRNEDEGHRK